MDKFFSILLTVLLAWASWIFFVESQQQALSDVDPEAELRMPQVEEPSFDMPDFSQYRDVKEKKQAFFDFLLPAVEQANQLILQERAMLLAINPKQATPQDRALLAALADKYQQPRKEQQSLAEWRRALLKKVDIIPPSLALAQAANESAWGTSRFALEAFNLYGQWCFSPGCGLVPTGRPEGKTYEVRKFMSPQASVEAYMLNLNAFHSYRELRRIRLALRERNSPITGDELAKGLIAYSQRREAYIEELTSMMHFNDLLKLDMHFAERMYAEFKR